MVFIKINMYVLMPEECIRGLSSALSAVEYEVSVIIGCCAEVPLGGCGPGRANCHHWPQHIYRLAYAFVCQGRSVGY